MDEGSTVIISLTKVMNDSSFTILNKTANLTGFPARSCQKPKDQPGGTLCSVGSAKQSGKEHLKHQFFSPTYVPLSGDSLSFQTSTCAHHTD